jgi:hypothetical protein
MSNMTLLLASLPPSFVMKIGTLLSPTTSSMRFNHRYLTIAPYSLRIIVALRSPNPSVLRIFR